MFFDAPKVFALKFKPSENSPDLEVFSPDLEVRSRKNFRYLKNTPARTSRGWQNLTSTTKNCIYRKAL